MNLTGLRSRPRRSRPCLVEPAFVPTRISAGVDCPAAVDLAAPVESRRTSARLGGAAKHAPFDRREASVVILSRRRQGPPAMMVNDSCPGPAFIADAVRRDCHVEVVWDAKPLSAHLAARRLLQHPRPGRSSLPTDPVDGRHHRRPHGDELSQGCLRHVRRPQSSQH